MHDGAWDLWTDEVFETGLRATWIAAAGLLIAAAIPGWVGHDPALVGVIVIGVSPALVLASTGVRRHLLDRWGAAVPVLWSVVVVGAVSIGVAVTGGPTSPVVVAYALPIVYFSTLYPGRVQLLLLLFLAATYAAVLAATDAPRDPGHLVWYTTALGTLAFLANRLSRQIQIRHERELEAEALAVRRAELIRVVVHAGEGQPLDTEAILEDLLEASRNLGMECAVLFEIEHDTATYVARSVAGCDETVGLPRPLDAGAVAEVAGSGDPVVVSTTDRRFGRDPLIREHGLASMVVVPIHLSGQVAAVIAAGTRNGKDVGVELVEAFELLAVRAANALSNARLLRTQSQTLARQRDIDRMKDDFIATASHELRTPVTVVKAATELLRIHWDAMDDRRRLDLLERLGRHVGRLDRVVDSLTRFRRLQTGDHEIELRPLQLRPQLTGVVDRYGTPERCDIDLEIEDDHAVLTDPQLLQVGLGELLENAAVHAGTSARITVHATDDHVVVAISDRGPGLPDNVLDNLRASFRRGGESERSQTGGLGLGLATAMTAFELLSVEPELDSDPGRGTTWRIPLPRAGERVVDVPELIRPTDRSQEPG